MDDDFEILDEIEFKKKKKSFQSIINKQKYNNFELDEIMLEV